MNHFLRGGCLTTKVYERTYIACLYTVYDTELFNVPKEGLTRHMRELPWYQNVSSDEFYPRCYNVHNEEERELFIGQEKITLCRASIVHQSVCDAFR